MLQNVVSVEEKRQSTLHLSSVYFLSCFKTFGTIFFSFFAFTFYPQVLRLVVIRTSCSQEPSQKAIYQAQREAMYAQAKERYGEIGSPWLRG